MRMRMKRGKLWLLCALLACLALPSGAHGFVVRAIPADRSVLERSPTRLQYWFSEDLEPRFSEIHLRDQTGQVLASGGVDPRNRALLALRAPSRLPDGAYVVELRPAFASDGHVIAESRVFFVGEAVGGVAGQTEAARAIPLEALWRALLNLANFVFFGASSLYALVLLPAWGSPGGAGLPRRVNRAMRNCLAVAVALAFAASLLALLQATMAFFNAGASQVLEGSLWQVVLIGSRFGDVWTFRFALLIFCAVLLFVAEYYRALMPGLAAGIWRGMPWLGALFIGLSMATSHAAGSTILPWLAIAVDWIHALAAAFWLGGALALALLLRAALAPLEGEAKRRAAQAALRRFSRLMGPLVALIVLSGLYTASNFLLSPADLDASYGRALTLKLLLLTPVVILAGWQRLHLRSGPPRLTKVLPPAWSARLAHTVEIGNALRLEAILMLLPLGAVAWLSATPVPEPPAPAVDIAAPASAQTVGGFSLSVSVIPGGPGFNTYDLLVSSGDGKADPLRIELQWVNPERALRSHWQRVERVEGGLYSGAGDEIDAPGEWQLLVDIFDEAGGRTRAAFQWEISEAAAIQQTRGPDLIHVLLLLALAAALAKIALPGFRKLVGALNLTALSAGIGLAVVALSLAVMAFGAGLIAQRQREYALALHPPPAIVNAVLPDAASLERGAALYRERCLVWQGQSADFRALRNRLGSARDDFLYAVVAEGWRSLPACEGQLSPEQRWDVVNYFRTFEARTRASE